MTYLAVRKIKEKEKKQSKEKPFSLAEPLRRIWIRVRQAYVTSPEAFAYSLSSLKDADANSLYDLVKHALFKGSIGEILRDTPALRPIIRNEDDRMCMIDVYEVLSWRLNRRESLPEDRKLVQAMRSGIGREMPDLR